MRKWKHRGRVFKNGNSWHWECYRCGPPLNVVNYPDQQSCFKRADGHAFVGGYELV